MPFYYITFVLPFNNSNNKEGYNSDFKNSFKLKIKDKLDLNKEILLFKDNNLDLNFKPKEGTSFINIKEYFMKIALIKPLELSFIKIFVFTPDYSPSLLLKSRVIYDIKTRI
jgi:hypothetical protein